MVEVNSQGLVERCLQEIFSACKEIGIPFVVFAFQYFPDQYKENMDYVRNIGYKKGFSVFITHEFFEGHKIDDLKNSIIDSHPNSFGHRLLAERVYHKIYENIDEKSYQLDIQSLQKKSIELKKYRDKFILQ